MKNKYTATVMDARSWEFFEQLTYNAEHLNREFMEYCTSSVIDCVLPKFEKIYNCDASQCEVAVNGKRLFSLYAIRKESEINVYMLKSSNIYNIRTIKIH